MNILFIWDGKEMSEFRRKCVERAPEVYPDAKLVCISKGDWSFEGYELLDWEPIKQKILERYGLGVDKTRPFSNFARFVYLSENAHTLYLDTDTYCTKPIPQSDKVGRWEWDSFILWNGENTKVFHEIIKNRKSNMSLSSHIPMLPDDSFDLKPYCQHKDTNLQRRESHEKIQTETV